jgi:hypothetical protein
MNFPSLIESCPWHTQQKIIENHKKQKSIFFEDKNKKENKLKHNLNLIHNININMRIRK